MRKTAVVGFALTATLTVLTAGCSDSDGSSTPAAASSTPSTTPVPPTAPAGDQDGEEQAVIDAYLAAIDAFYLAANPPDPDHPALDDTSAGKFREALRELLASQRDQGIGARRGHATANHPRVIAIAGETAQVEDCLNDADVQFDLETGQTLDDSVIHIRFVAQLQKLDGSWLVTRRDIAEELSEPCR